MSDLPMVAAVAGARWSTTAAGIKTPAEDGSARLDLALLELAAGSSVSAVFTRNAFCAAPVQVARAHLDSLRAAPVDSPIYCLVNSGNANAGTGAAGINAAQSSCQILVERLGVAAEAILPYSTGVIGELLPVEKIEQVSQQLVEGLSAGNWAEAARAIMTTDTLPKTASRKVIVDGAEITISGIAKGAGMIKPDMATMLAYVVTDACISQPLLDTLLGESVNRSFNRITVDGDTSTNDACLLAATGAAAVELNSGSRDWPIFKETLLALMQELATAIIRDAEGASKFITLDIINGADAGECLQVGYTVAESPLVKTAFFASDANWGRILAAVGRSGVRQLDVNKVEILLDDYCICAGGGRIDNYDEDKAMAIMARPEITICINLARGTHSERIWTSDLSHDYVRINAEYRT